MQDWCLYDFASFLPLPPSPKQLLMTEEQKQQNWRIPTSFTKKTLLCVGENPKVLPSSPKGEVLNLERTWELLNFAPSRATHFFLKSYF